MRKDLLKRIDELSARYGKQYQPFLVFVSKSPEGGWIASERFQGGKTKEIHIDSLDDLNERYEEMGLPVIIDDFSDDPVLFAADEDAMRKVFRELSIDNLRKMADDEMTDEEIKKVLTESAERVANEN